MNKQLLELYLERGRLQERIAYQRAELSVQLMPLKTASASASRIFSAGQSGIDVARNNPLWVMAALAAVVVLRPKGVWRLLKTGLVVWRGWRGLSALIPAAALSPLYQFIWRRYAKK